MKRNCAKIHTTLFTRINLIIVLVTTICMALGATLMIRYTVQPSLEKDRLLSKECYNSLTEAVESKYNLVYHQHSVMLSNDHVASRIASVKDNPDRLINFMNSVFLTSYIDSVFSTDPDILDIIIVSATGHYSISRSSNNGRVLKPRYDYLSLPVAKSLLESEHTIMALRDDIQSYANSISGPVVTFAIKLTNPISMASREPVAYAFINYPVSSFDNSYRQYGALSSSELYVATSTGNILYSNNPSAYENGFALPENDRYEIDSKRISNSDITVYSCLSKELIDSATMNLIMTMLKILIPCILAILVCVLILNNKYQQRIQDLVESMEAVSTEGLSTRIEIRHDDELARLSNHFNKMCDDLERYIDLHYKSELERQTAELNALQAQINPHFLFNTIESIRMRAIDDGASEVSDMLERMGTLFRWMIQMDKQVVYLEDEIDFINSYLSLQSYRYNYCFEYSFDIPNDLLYMGIPKFTIQPIVENALLHGINRDNNNGEISVSARADDHTLKLFIHDNGKGMNKETLSELMLHIKKESEYDNRFGIGIQNVNSRIVLWFGPDFGVKIESEPDNGTSVTVTIPTMPKKEMSEYVSNHTNRR